MNSTTARTPRIIRTPAAAGVALALWIAGAAAAQFDIGGSQPQESAERYAKVRLLSDRSSIAPGETFHLIVLFDIEPGWHIYWRNPGVGPMTPSIRVHGPETFHIGAPRWPRPKVIESAVGDMYGHEKRAAIFIPITASPTISDGAVFFSADIGYAVCDHRRCFFGRSNVATSVDVNIFGGAPAAGEDATVIETQRKRLPLRASETDGALAELVREDGNPKLVLIGPAHGFTEVAFYPFNSPGVTYAALEVTFDEGHFRAVIELLVEPVNFTRGAPRVGGVIALGKKLDDPSYEYDLPLIDQEPVDFE